MGKYQPTKYPNITTYETKKGTRYRVRKKYYVNGKAEILDESNKKTLAEARARLREVEEQLDKMEPGYVRSHKLTVNEYYEEYAKRKFQTKKWSLDSKNANDSLFKNHIFPVYGNTPLIRITRSSYEEFIAKKLQVLRKKSVESIHCLFMSILNDATYNGTLDRNRLQRIDIGESVLPPKNKQVSLEDYQKWMRTAEFLLTKYEYSMIYLCIYGLRRGEVCGIRQSVIHYNDADLAVVYIDNSRTAKTAKNGKGGVKNSSSERYIVLDRRGTNALKYIINEAQEIRRDFNSILHEDDFLMLNPSTNKPYHPIQLNRLFEKVSKTAEIKINPHLLRHFFATQAAIAGAPKEHVAAYLGHSDKTMTAHYTHIQDETAGNVVDIVSRRLNNKQEHA